jgi:amidophosphoribosyltransferase
MLVARDPLGIKPLCYAKEGPLFAAASESVALLNLGFRPENIQSLPPGRRSRSTAASSRSSVCRAAAPGPLLLRVDLLRQRRQHAGRAQRLSVAHGAGRGTGAAGAGRRPRADRRGHDRRAGARHQQGGGRRDGVPPGRAVARGADPQPLRGRTFIEGTGNRREGRDQVHAAARSAGRQAGVLVEDSIVRSTTMRVLLNRIRERGRREGDSRPRRLPADRRALLLRHRHVDDRRAVRAASFCRGGELTGRSPGRNGRGLGADSLRYLPVESIARAIGLPTDSSAGPASPAAIPRRTARSSTTWRGSRSLRGAFYASSTRSR